MAAHERSITNGQAAAVLVSSLIGVSILSLPRIMVEDVNYGAPLATLIGLGISSIGLWALTSLGIRYSRYSLVDYSKLLLGRWIGTFIPGLIVLFFIVILGLTVREFADMMNTIVLADTPQVMILMIVLTAIAIACRYDIVSFATIQFFYAPFLVVPMILLILISIPDMDITNILPVWGNRTDAGDFVRGAVRAAGMPFSQIGMFVISILIPYMKTPNQAGKGMWIGLGLSGLTILLVVTATLAVLSAEEIVHDVWPAMALTRMAQLPAQILERIDLMYLWVWIGTALTTLYSGYMLTVYHASRLFAAKSHHGFAFPILPMILIVALLPRSTLTTYYWIEAAGLFGLLLTVGYPVALLLVAKLREKGRTHHADGE